MKAEEKSVGTNGLMTYRFLDLVDISLIDQLFNSFYLMTGLQYSILDTENNILVMKGWQDICTKFHRVCPSTEARCKQSDSYIFDHLEDGLYVAYKCLNGLMEYATPIIVEGRHLATIYLGQVLHSPPDEYYFRQQAKTYGFDEESYVDALRKVPIFPEDSIKSIIEFYAQLGRLLANMGLERIRQLKFVQTLCNNVQAISITTLDEGRFVQINDAWAETMGYTPDEIIGLTSSELNIWLDSDNRDSIIQRIKDEGRIRNADNAFRNKSGDIVESSLSAEIIDIGGKPHLLVVSKDITDQIKAREALRLSEERFSKAFNANPNPELISTLEEGRIIEVNDACCGLFGYSRDEFLNRTVFELGIWSDPADRHKIKDLLLKDELISGIEVFFRRKSGEKWLALFSSVRIDVNGEACLLSNATDITDRKKAEEEIRFLSFHDKLTGLYNRAFFETELKRLDSRRNLPLSLIVGDVNGLKRINDALGHQEGDKILMAVAAILKESCREEDLIARWGGDEFIILLPQCDYYTALRIVERINNNCNPIDILPIQTSISLGLASKTLPSCDIREVIKEAEDKMYRQKLLNDKSTRNSFIVSLENTLWTRSHETKEHCERIQKIAQIIGKAIDLTDSELDNIKLLSVLHDIGKIAIPNSILEKPGKLTHEEWDAIKKHPEIGYRIALSSPDIAPIAEAILHHHERWDGTGYPLGLIGEEIPLISRIIAIADAYDVMIIGRPYQKAYAKEEVWAEIERCAGSQFDPVLVRKAIEVFVEL